jgi:AbiV family abortive infection protein
MSSKAETFSRSIAACVANGRKLLEDAKYLFDWDRFSTALALAVLAQEEFAKAFLLQLVLDDALPWIPVVRRSIARHQCKHLLAIVMEWLPDFDRANEQFKQNMAKHQEKLERFRQGKGWPDEAEPVFQFPSEVATALNIYRYEEIERLSRRDPWKDADWATGKARKIADGSLDQKKQSAFYVDITRTGEVGLHPGLITREEASKEIERAERLSESPETCSDEYYRLKKVLPLLFSNLSGKTAPK